MSEIAVLAPIRAGRVPGERRTFEQRLRFVIENIQKRAEEELPTLLNKVQSIHFGRLIIIRPEQYLHYSDVPGVAYMPEAEDAQAGGDPAPGRIPLPFDDYREAPMGGVQPPPRRPGPSFRSFLLTIVSFDGDLQPYFRDIADYLSEDFDRVFENCEDYDTTADFDTFWAWVRRYQIPVDLFHAANPGLSVAEIKRLQDFKRRFDEFVAQVRAPGGRRDVPLDQLFDAFLRETQQYPKDFPTAGGSYLPGDDR